jgi:1,4-dihydroxy-2-naphthoate octaprenyltransferase
MAHISVNMLNEYHDFKSGLDLITERTPFSGGSGSLPAKPEVAGKVLSVALVSLMLTAAIGIYLISIRGLDLVYLGLFGLLVVLAYTPLLNKHPLACLIAAGAGFGPVMVLGTEIALAGEPTLLASIASLVPFFLVNNLLLLNQYPDIEADKRAGRNHVLIAYGRLTGAKVYALFNTTSCLVFALTLYLVSASWQWLLLIPVCLLAFKLSKDVLANHNDVYKLVTLMGPNVLLTLTTPLLLALSTYPL